jgi:hypothetical protein
MVLLRQAVQDKLVELRQTADIEVFDPDLKRLQEMTEQQRDAIDAQIEAKAQQEPRRSSPLRQSACTRGLGKVANGRQGIAYLTARPGVACRTAGRGRRQVRHRGGGPALQGPPDLMLALVEPGATSPASSPARNVARRRSTGAGPTFALAGGHGAGARGQFRQRQRLHRQKGRER